MIGSEKEDSLSAKVVNRVEDGAADGIDEGYADGDAVGALVHSFFPKTKIPTGTAIAIISAKATIE